MIVTESLPPRESPAEAQDAAVVVPSFARPDLLSRCLRALAGQRARPGEVIVVGREGDHPTAEAAEAAKRELGLPLRSVTVAAPGHLLPLAAGVGAARAAIVCFVDDDAEPWPDWISALVRHYADPQVGGVGGLVSQPGPAERAVAQRVARLGATGRFAALKTERVPATWGARSADVLRGTNMSFRRELLFDYPWDARLNRGAATDYEVDLCAWVRRRGYRLVYDPDAAVTHHLGRRSEIGRGPTPKAIEDYSHNLVYVAGKALPPAQAVLTIAGALLIGNRLSYGLVTALVDSALGRPPSLRDQLRPALAGKLAGLRSLAAYWRAGPLPLAQG